MDSQNWRDLPPQGMDIIAAVADAVKSGRGLESILDNIIDLVLEIMSAEACSIWLYERGALRLKAGRGLNMAAADASSIELGDGVTGRVGLHREPIAISDVREDNRFKPIPELGNEAYMSILSVPMTDQDRLVGVLNVRTVEPYSYTETEMKFATYIAAQLVGAIRNTQLYEEVIKGFREIAIIHLVSEIINSVRDIDEMTAVIARTCAEHLSTRGCVLRMLDPATGLLEIKGSHGVPASAAAAAALRIGEGLAGKCAAEKRAILRKDLLNDPGEFADALGLGMKSAICAPLVVKDRVVGTLGVFDKLPEDGGEPISFEEEDAGLVTIIANQAAMAIENARLYAEKDARISELQLLLEISNIMRGTLDFESLLYIILTSVTMSQGFGFNRALLFLHDEKSGTLKGEMAVGPLRAADASRHWHSFTPKGKTLQEVVLEYGKFNREAGFEIDMLVKKMSVPVKPDKGALARTVLERTSFNVADYNPAEGGEEAALAAMGFSTFATVPLIAREKVVGIMVVDNLVTRAPITDEQLEFVQLFANQAASVLETSRLYKNIEQANRRLVDARELLVRSRTLATLGEFSAGIAHELRNPLVSIGGFARRLARKLPPDSEEARHARIIFNEVEGMEKILSQILEFVGGAKTETQQVDIIGVFEQVFVLLHDAINSKNISVNTDFDERARTLLVDEVQMRQLFINLIKNAVEAMKGEGGSLRVKTTLMETEEGGVGLEISDTGVGISSEDLEHVFDPFFTRKSTGTGLGLSVCARIVEGNHGGKMFIDSRKGEGTSVLIWLPPETLAGGESGGGRGPLSENG